MTKRKSISKKLRFEIFKRDNFCCAYCGQRPPQTTLEIDHIRPVADGGANEETNLVTSCFECNRGKSDRLLTSIPESLSDRAKRIKECEDQLAAYRKITDAKKDRIESDCWQVVHAIFGEETNKLRSDWFASIKRFLSSLELGDVIESGEIAGSKMHFNTDKKKFTYFCGICWNKIRENQNG